MPCNSGAFAQTFYACIYRFVRRIHRYGCKTFCFKIFVDFSYIRLLYKNSVLQRIDFYRMFNLLNRILLNIHAIYLFGRRFNGNNKGNYSAAGTEIYVYIFSFYICKITEKNCVSTECMVRTDSNFNIIGKFFITIQNKYRLKIK